MSERRSVSSTANVDTRQEAKGTETHLRDGMSIESWISTHGGLLAKELGKSCAKKEG